MHDFPSTSLSTVSIAMKVMTTSTNIIVLMGLFGCVVMLFGADVSKIFQSSSRKKCKSGKVVECGHGAKKKRTSQYLWYTPKKQNFLENEIKTFSCIKESQEEKEDRIWESDSKGMLKSLEREFEEEKNRSVLIEDSHSFVWDEESSELITLYSCCFPLFSCCGHYSLVSKFLRLRDKELQIVILMGE